MSQEEIKPIMTQKARNIERYSIVRLSDGTIAVWERKGMIAITEWGKKGIKLHGDTELEVLKFPAHLASEFLKSITGQIL